MKPRLRLGIRGKFILIVAIILTAVFTIIAFYLASSDTAKLEKELYDQARSFSTLATTPIGSVFTIYKDSGTLNIDHELKEFSKLNANVSNIAIADIDGNILYSQRNSQVKGITKAQAESFEPIYTYSKSGVVERIIYPYKESSGIRRYNIIYDISSQSIRDSVVKAFKYNRAYYYPHSIVHTCKLLADR
jgi:hypothetical protein